MSNKYLVKLKYMHFYSPFSYSWVLFTMQEFSLLNHFALYLEFIAESNFAINYRYNVNVI